MTEEKVLKIAEEQVGYLEKKSNKSLDSKTANAGKSNYTKFSVPFGVNGCYWCCYFIMWIFYTACGNNKAKAKEMLSTLTGACETLRQSMKKKGWTGKVPKAGALIFFKGTRHAGANHIGIVYKVDATYVYTIEGNTSGASGVVDNGGGVSKKKYKRTNSNIIEYGYPNYEREVRKVIPDISHHHPVKAWGTVKKICPFLISKATQGTAYVDPTLLSFIKGCESNGIPYYLYAFLNKGNELKQAKFLVETCKGKVGTCFRGYILDVEKNNAASDVKSALSYLESLPEKDLKIGLYTMYAQFSKYSDVINKRGTHTFWWEARYGINDGLFNSVFKPHQGADLHQYTSAGTCDGIGTKAIDLNRLTGTKSESWFTNKANVQPTKKEKYSGDFPNLPARGFFQKGDKGTQVKRVQKFLNWYGSYGLDVDGEYGPLTANAVKKFQSNYKLSVDGLFGKASLAVAKAVEKITM